MLRDHTACNVPVELIRTTTGQPFLHWNVVSGVADSVHVSTCEFVALRITDMCGNSVFIGNQSGAGADVRISAACCVHIVCEANCFRDISDGGCTNC